MCVVAFDVLARVCSSFVLLGSDAVNVPLEMVSPERARSETSPSPSLPITAVAVPSLPVIRAVPWTWRVCAAVVVPIDTFSLDTRMTSE